MNLDDLLKSIREEDDSKGAKIDTEKFFQTKTFINPLKGQRYQAPGLPSAPPVVVKPTVVKIDPEKLIPENSDVVSEELGDKLNELIKVIREDNELEEESQKEDKKQLEAKKKKDREDRIESKKETKSFVIDLKKSTGKVGGFFDKLKDFLKITLLSGLINTLYNFLTDPKNKEKIAATQKFLKNYWPAVLGALAYFFTPFGKLVNFVVGTVGKFLLKLGLLVAKNPILLAALGGAALGIAGSELAKQRQEEARERQRDFLRELGVRFEDKETGEPLTDRDKEFDPTPFIDTPDNPVQIEQREPGFLEKLRNTRDKFIFGTEFGPNQTIFPPPGSSLLTNPSYQFRGGGLSMGTDVVPAMLTPGEFIMSRGAVNMFGVDTMMAMNKAGGGTNRPKLGKVMGYQQGGMVGAEPPKLPQKGKDFWTLVAVAGTEDNDPQAWADVAQSIYNRQMSGLNFNQIDNSISGFILGKEQYEPTWKLPKPGKKGIPNLDWYNINDIQTASMATGKSIAYLQRVADAIQNPTYQKKARKFVGGKTDFMGGDEKPKFELGDVRRGKQGEDNFFGFFAGTDAEDYGKTSPSAAEIPSFVGTQPTIPLPIKQSEKIKPPEKSRQQQIRDNFDSIRRKLSDPIETFIKTPFRNVFPVGTPNVPTETKNFVLPPIESPKQNQSSSQTNDIPSFSVVSSNKMRDLISKDLGIGDLAGVS